MAINSVSISGNLTRNAEMRVTQNGGSVLTFSVAVNERQKTPQGEWVDNPNYFECAIFGKRADALEPYLTKGTKVSILGRLKQSRWKNDAGETRSKVSIVVQEIEFNAPKSASKAVSNESAPSAYSDEDIPF